MKRKISASLASIGLLAGLLVGSVATAGPASAGVNDCSVHGGDSGNNILGEAFDELVLGHTNFGSTYPRATRGAAGGPTGTAVYPGTRIRCYITSPVSSIVVTTRIQWQHPAGHFVNLGSSSTRTISNPSVGSVVYSSEPTNVAYYGCRGSVVSGFRSLTYVNVNGVAVGPNPAVSEVNYHTCTVA